MSKSSDTSISLDRERLELLAKLPLLLNSSLETKQVIGIALRHLQNSLGAEAATVFLFGDSEEELIFWALHGGDTDRLEGQRMPASAGIVGKVIQSQAPHIAKDVQKNPHFFGEIDNEGGFTTRSLICTPLTAKGGRKIGALQGLNKIEGEFSDEDLAFLEQFSHQLTLAIDNARLFEETRQKQKMLERLDQRKSEMITVISHEFRTPLSVIQSSAELLSSGLLEEDSNRQISDTLLSGVSRLTGLVADIRNISLAAGEGLPLRKGQVAIHTLFDEIISRLGPEASKRQISIDKSVQNDIADVSCDQGYTLVVLQNLVSNAIRFTPDSGTIQLGAEQSSGLVEISVEDDGIGIDESELALIFEAFYEVHDAMQHSSGTFEFKSGGLGLGLATARAIVKAHGSSIEVTSTPGKGSRFCFRLPVAG